MEKDKKIKSAIVETYAEDMAKVIENDTEGLVKKIIHGEEKHEAEKENQSPESKKNKLFMFVSFLLIFLALAILSFFLFRKTPNTVPVESQFVPIVFNDQMVNVEVLDFSKDQIIQAVLDQINATRTTSGELEGIYPTENKQIIGLRKFFALIKSNFVPGDNPTFVNDNFLMGIVNGEMNSVGVTDKGFFILLKVRSAADIFDALRAWEPKMLSDLHGLLGINLGSNTNYLFSKDFEDGIVENKNARILYDKDSKIVLMYVFADDNSVIITDSQNAVHEIILRLASASKKQ